MRPQLATHVEEIQYGAFVRVTMRNQLDGDILTFQQATECYVTMFIYWENRVTGETV
jgi:hypothetical protein